MAASTLSPRGGGPPRLADRIRLLHVDPGGDVARGALQIIRHRPVILVAVRLAHHVGHERGDPAQLGMPEGIRGTGVGEEPAVRIGGSLGDHDHAVTAVADALSHALEKFLLLERHFRKPDDVGWLYRESTRLNSSD